MLKIVLDPVMPWKPASLTRTAKLQPAFVRSSFLSLVLISTCQVDLDVQGLYSPASMQGGRGKKALQSSTVLSRFGTILLISQGTVMKTHGIQHSSFEKITPVISGPGDRHSSH